MRIKIAVTWFLYFCVTSGMVMAQTARQDTLPISVKQAEDLFLKNNLQLIIQKYNIDNASAQVITAKLFNNPDFSFSNGIFATQVENAAAEQSANLSQLFTTAGKRNKNIKLAKIAVEQAKYQMFDLLRTLKFTLRSDFFTVYFQQQSASVYTEEINSLSKTLKAYKEQYAKGNIAQKELLRIQSQLYSLQGEYNSLLVGIDTTEAELRLLTKLPPTIHLKPVYADSIDNQSVTLIPYQKLLDSAYVNRYDLRLAKSTIDYNNLNLDLQKANAIPDVTLSVNFDKLGSYGNNFVSGGIGFALPFFNRNQGAIKQAHIAIEQSKVQLTNQQMQVESSIATTYTGAVRLENLYHSFDPHFKSDFTHLIREVYINYEKRNLSLLEFLDFYDSYKTNTLQLNNVQLSRVTSLEQLNYVTGTPFFNQQ